MFGTKVTEKEKLEEAHSHKNCAICHWAYFGKIPDSPKGFIYGLSLFPKEQNGKVLG